MDMQERSAGLFLYDTDVDFSSRNNFANLGFFAKVSVPVESVTPWFDQGIMDIFISTIPCFDHLLYLELSTLN